MKKFILSFIAILLLVPLLAMASCDPKDLNDSFPLKDMEVIQGSKDVASSAYVAAQLLEFNLRSNDRYPYPSALQLSAQASTPKIVDIVWKVNNVGFPPKECVEKQVNSYVGGNSITIEEFNSLLHAVYRNRDAFTNNFIHYRNMKLLSDDITLGDCSAPSVLDNLFEKGVWGKSPSEILTKLVMPCGAHVHYWVEYEEITSGDDQTMMKKLDSFLQSNVPAGVEICEEILSEKGLKDRLPGGAFPRGSVPFMMSCSPRSVLATARRKAKEGGACEYLIRNSMGLHWRPDGLSCACKTLQKYYPDCPSNSREMSGGEKEFNNRIYLGCWIPSTSLAPNLTQVGAIKLKFQNKWP